MEQDIDGGWGKCIRMVPITYHKDFDRILDFRVEDLKGEMNEDLYGIYKLLRIAELGRVKRVSCKKETRFDIELRQYEGRHEVTAFIV